MKDYIVNHKLIDEWDWGKNSEFGLDPNKLTLGSNKKAWWICRVCGHSWFAKIENRAVLHRGCPQCAKGKQTSSPEQKIYYYIKKYFSDAINRYSNNDCGITELDIYIPSLRVAIEYDGGKWHQDINKDKLKDLLCENNNINLIRMRDPKCPVYDSNCSFIYLESRSLRHLADAILCVLKILGIDNPVVDFDNDLADVETLICYQIKDNSLVKLFPDIAAEWNYSKNGNLIPENVSAHSGKRVWWKCHICGHEWITDICSRVDGTGCPECKKEKIRQAQSEPVYCPELGQQFRSGCEAARQTGIRQTHISRCCLGKAKSAGKHPITGEKLTWIKV